ncbi:MAG: bifunctional glutamate N-acetyltransferase/amino-acid acetyltransferase ArgJ [Verrucomicrobia bacterium]|nr:bifunctional glutamate N-acetyltransferase/amino-acid acetyltransferase ArgJ [Verrucomicrobiota bacterium]
MSFKLKSIPGSIVAPQGFQSSGVFCDIKRLGTGKGSNKGRKLDLGLIVSQKPATAAGLFTTNQVCAAPVKVCIPKVKAGHAQAIVVNSGNANACTGRRGLKDADRMAGLAAGLLGLDAAKVLVASTGRIGVPLPMQNVERGIAAASQSLGHDIPHADQTAEAIMTSDSRPKQAAVEFSLGGKIVRLGGICKGAGMIQPGMSPDGKHPASQPQGLHATMLAFLTTDATVEASVLQAALNEAVALSFNRITVDGDMSTNDTVLVLANGAAGARSVTQADLKSRSSAYRVFSAALQRVCLELALMIVRDGEGVHRVVTVRIHGADSHREADAAARSIGNSALVKTSWHGGDPNWGRIIDALGYSPARVVEEKVDIGYSTPGSKKILWTLRRGQPTKTSFKAQCAAVSPKEFDLHVRLNLGAGSAVLYAADLTEEYVDFNKGDVGDPASLGG